MTSPFNNYLNSIACEHYAFGDHADFYTVRDFVKKAVTENPRLKSICNAEFITFGSAAHGIRMYDTDEYDVIIELKFPNYIQIFVQPDHHRMGLVHLCFEQLLTSSTLWMKMWALLDNYVYLKREGIHNWMQGILVNVHDLLVQGKDGHPYKLHYKRRQNCHTITARSQTRKFSIDFVPAIKVWFEGADCQVVPKWAPGPKYSNGRTFLLSDIRKELELFQKGGKVVRDAVILLKVLCKAKGLPKIRFYHLVSVALWYMDIEDVNNSSLEHVFLGMLDNLRDFFKENELPNYTCLDEDLLSKFMPYEVAMYAQDLDDAYNTLKTYPHQQQLSYETCSWHFYEEDF